MTLTPTTTKTSPPEPAVDHAARAIAARISAVAGGVLGRVLVVGAEARAAAHALPDSRCHIIELALPDTVGAQPVVADAIADSRWLPLADRVVDLCISRVPTVGPDPWGHLAELIRVARAGGLIALIGDRSAHRGLRDHLRTRRDVAPVARPRRVADGVDILRRLP